MDPLSLKQSKVALEG
ncbi:hypothetical protein MTR67_014020 [Solanum verrucosum]|uniref:Uncharacterized protein n=1 Tax=Solanum verrucosum TaxID=315347 RepID=A0AAF0TPC1_SOLVR|nr:hypothetical protein MTR67_014020 [Solanum verrucosum]